MGTVLTSKKHIQHQPMIADIKLAPPIQHVVIIGEKQVDRKIWYVLQVVPLRADVGLVKGIKKAVVRKTYTIARQYDEFVQLSQNLHDHFSTDASPHPSAMTSRSGQRLLINTLPKLSTSKRLQILHNKKQVQQQRRTDLDMFIDTLFRLHPSIAQSLIVLEFFGQKNYDSVSTMSSSPSSSQLLRPPMSMASENTVSHSTSLRKSISHPELVPGHSIVQTAGAVHPLDSKNHQQHQQRQQPPPPPPLPVTMSPLWRRFRTRGPTPTTTVSSSSSSSSLAAAAAAAVVARPIPQPSSSLTALCGHAANMIMPWKQHLHHQQLLLQQQPQPQPILSCSTPMDSSIRTRWLRKEPSFQKTPVLPQMGHSPTTVSTSSSSIMSSTSTGSSCYSRDSQSTRATSVSPITSPSPSPTTSPTLRMIKIKVVYDANNIIVVQVPRSASLMDLRHRILQKFSDLALTPNFSLVFNDTRSSASSCASACASADDNGPPSTLVMIEKEEDFTAAMGSLWVRLDKVTLRCTVP